MENYHLKTFKVILQTAKAWTKSDDLKSLHWEKTPWAETETYQILYPPKGGIRYVDQIYSLIYIRYIPGRPCSTIIESQKTGFDQRSDPRFTDP